jgi:ketol-acid reductoisomerase
LHELKLIVDLMYEKGITGMRAAISDTAKWGDVNIGRRIITSATKEEMKKVLDEIQSGQFAREWMAENANGRHNFDSKLEADKNHQIESVGEKLRGDMSWMKDKA